MLQTKPSVSVSSRQVTQQPWQALLPFVNVNAYWLVTKVAKATDKATLSKSVTGARLHI
jgi:hypothetical protein